MKLSAQLELTMIEKFESTHLFIDVQDPFHHGFRGRLDDFDTFFAHVGDDIRNVLDHLANEPRQTMMSDQSNQVYQFTHLFQARCRNQRRKDEKVKSSQLRPKPIPTNHISKHRRRPRPRNHKRVRKPIHHQPEHRERPCSPFLLERLPVLPPNVDLGESPGHRIKSGGADDCVEGTIFGAVLEEDGAFGAADVFDRVRFDGDELDVGEVVGWVLC